MVRVFLFMMILVSFPAQVFASVLSSGTLAKDCSQSNLIFNSAGEMVGQQIDPFCSGYLEGTLETLISFGNTKCTSSLLDDQTPDGLLSIFITYRSTKNVSDSSPAAPTLISAYLRAFDCD